ncbi:MAG: hypothetical protein F4226_04620 [Synechococcus sp. SB0678_bin_12]|nr:hypothetical protein [Synechococcus sp. SB0678_bin_12]MYI88313.1 hypothetical protein [Synechococcus sp. SB0672_bin_10]
MVPSTSPLPAALVNDWLKPAAVVGVLALLPAAFHGLWQEIRATEASLRSDFKADIQGLQRAGYGLTSPELRADNQGLEPELDRVLASLLQP